MTLRIARLGLLRCIFNSGLIESFVKLKKIIRNHDCLGSSESYNPSDPERS